MNRRLLLVFLLLILTQPCLTYAKGAHVNVDHSKTSKILIVGDSRACYLAIAAKKTFPALYDKFSYNGVCGGHYFTASTFVSGEYQYKPCVINYPAYVSEQKETIKKTLKKHGSCKVIIMGTVNDTKYGKNLQDKSLKNINTLKKEFEKIRVKYKRKRVSPKVYIASVIPPIDDIRRADYYNRKLKSRYKNSFIYLGGYDQWKSYYIDRLHFNYDGSIEMHSILEYEIF